MRDTFDTITGDELPVACPECGGYDEDGYTILPDEFDDTDLEGLSQCTICGRYFL